jgi:hypothetical protein
MSDGLNQGPAQVELDPAPVPAVTEGTVLGVPRVVQAWGWAPAAC